MYVDLKAAMKWRAEEAGAMAQMKLIWTSLFEGMQSVCFRQKTARHPQQICKHFPIDRMSPAV